MRHRARAGAARGGGVVANCPEGADFYQSEGVIGSFDGHWHDGAPPMILIAKEDAAALRAGLPERALMTLDAERSPGTRGANAVGFMPGERGRRADRHRGAPRRLVPRRVRQRLGRRRDARDRRALTAVRAPPPPLLCFTSRTAEEYGLENSPFDWCIGAWRQVQDSHPEWGARAPFHLCVEASGHPELRLLVEAPAELAGWVRAAARVASREGWLTSSWRVAPPGDRHGAVAAAGVRRPRHQRAHVGEVVHADRLPHAARHAGPVDFDHLERLTRFYAYLLLQADADPDAILDHGARADDCEAADRSSAAPASASPPPPRRRGARGRAAFTAVGRALLAIDAARRAGLPAHAGREGRRGAPGRARRARRGRPARRREGLRGVGANALAPKLSQAAFALPRPPARRRRREHSWASASHLTASPDLWAEIASLTGRPGAEPHGGLDRRSLKAASRAVAGERRARVEAMASALEDTKRRSS